MKQIEDLFTKGFAQIWEHNLSPAFDSVNERIDKLQVRMDKLEKEMTALSSKVTNYLELSDKRYLELKRKNLILVKWVKTIAEKTGVNIDLKELEEFT